MSNDDGHLSHILTITFSPSFVIVTTIFQNIKTETQWNTLEMRLQECIYKQESFSPPVSRYNCCYREWCFRSNTILSPRKWGGGNNFCKCETIHDTEQMVRVDTHCFPCSAAITKDMVLVNSVGE